MKKNIIKKIKVGILADEPLFWGSRKYYHKIILDGYTWKKNNNTYIISASYIYDRDVIKGKLNLENFNLLLIPGGGVGNNQALTKGLTCFSSVRKFKRNIADFVKSGGGLLGICGGAAFITDMIFGDNRKPKTLVEKLYHKSSLNISCVSSYFRALAFPLLYVFQYRYPENIGNSAYAFSFAPGRTTDGKYIMTTGCPLDVQINKDNPIFSDINNDFRRIRWWAGQSLWVSDNPDRDVKILARFPKDDVSKNDSIKIHAWRYTGGIHGFLKAIYKSFKMTKKYELGLSFVPLFTYYLASDWEPTGRVIELRMDDNPCMTSEIYPNENAARIVLSTVHSEYMVWWGGHIENNSDNEMNCIGNGFYRWRDIDKLSSKLQKELTPLKVKANYAIWNQLRGLVSSDIKSIEYLAGYIEKLELEVFGKNRIPISNPSS